MTALPDLHDAVLERVEVDWRLARCSIAVRLAAGSLRIVGDGFTLVSVPRAEPWGPSAGILEARPLRFAKGGAWRLELELQSGDVLALEAASITCERA